MDAPQPDIPSRALRRREALIAFAGVAVGGLWQAACGSGNSKTVTSGAGTTTTKSVDGQASAAVCVLSPEVTEGPYYIANHLRSEERRVGKECRSRWATDHQ